ncbi:MAG: cellulase family glycosylhydrolase [Candidatus Hydrogenedens sp.]|jgi:endoglucanase|nr:cellulase family glycosylhydrolase [Candidatus Hydrogenedens sp.]
MNSFTSALSRRNFLGLSTAALTWAVSPARADTEAHEPTAPALPKWYGFNLLEKFMMPYCGPFQEKDFILIQELGFNFVRLPMDYRHWVDPDNWTDFKEDVLKEIDEAIAFGDKYKIHVCLNFHRAPGYTVAQPAEKLTLWKDKEALDACALHWKTFAKRYAGIPNERLSFNLFNEPGAVSAEKHYKVTAHIVDEIREVDPRRLIICDGRLWGRMPPEELLPLGVAASTRGYEPIQLTHYLASWLEGADRFPLPDYPVKGENTVMDKQWLKEKHIDPWKALEEEGMPVMVGEFGAFSKTPHTVVLSWMEDCLELWKEMGWGWALWNFRGEFGILDSNRRDVIYDNWRGHKLDRSMLALLQRYVS